MLRLRPLVLLRMRICLLSISTHFCHFYRYLMLIRTILIIMNIFKIVRWLKKI